jgi:acyl-CoA synthetase (AMP-forming)/AMP-acid ligase II
VLENALMLHPPVEEAAVVAVPDDTWQERPVAWIKVLGDVSDDIPKTSVGKANKAYPRQALVSRRDSEALWDT